MSHDRSHRAGVNKDVSAAERAAAQAPVIITDRGRPSHVHDGVDPEPGRFHLHLETPEL